MTEKEMKEREELANAIFDASGDLQEALLKGAQYIDRKQFADLFGCSDDVMCAAETASERLSKIGSILYDIATLAYEVRGDDEFDGRVPSLEKKEQG